MRDARRVGVSQDGCDTTPLHTAIVVGVQIMRSDGDRNVGRRSPARAVGGGEDPPRMDERAAAEVSSTRCCLQRDEPRVLPREAERPATDNRGRHPPSWHEGLSNLRAETGETTARVKRRRRRRRRMDEWAWCTVRAICSMLAQRVLGAWPAVVTIPVGRVQAAVVAVVLTGRQRRRGGGRWAVEGTRREGSWRVDRDPRAAVGAVGGVRANLKLSAGPAVVAITVRGIGARVGAHLTPRPDRRRGGQRRGAGSGRREMRTAAAVGAVGGVGADPVMGARTTVVTLAIAMVGALVETLARGPRRRWGGTRSAGRGGRERAIRVLANANRSPRPEQSVGGRGRKV